MKNYGEGKYVCDHCVFDFCHNNKNMCHDACRHEPMVIANGETNIYREIRYKSKIADPLECTNLHFCSIRRIWVKCIPINFLHNRN